MSDEFPSFEDAINEYYKLKNKFDSDNMLFKKKIINNPTLSKREKRSAFLKFKPSCVNCKARTNKGTLFSIIFNKATDKDEEYRTLNASCGDLANPCNFEIKINVGKFENSETILNNLQKEIKEYKNNIIDDKNKLLFGLITTETAIENFDTNKSYVGELTSLYEKYLSSYLHSIENPEKKILLEESLVQTYQSINEIKECIKKMHENNDSRYASDVANIYQTKLYPLLTQIRHLKYSENLVFHDDNTDTCRLIQNKYTANELAVTSEANNKVIKFDVGIRAKKAPKKQFLLIESDSSEPEEKFKIDIKEQTQEGKPIPPDKPIIGECEDGISWNNPLYQKLWNALPVKLKNEFKINVNWMNEFMFKCVNTRQIKGNTGCELTTPPDIILPPKQKSENEYDFGVSVYNKVFNKLPKTAQTTYLTLYKLDTQTGEKDYKVLIETLNRLVGQELGFDRGFF
jgi:hypothetical protein